MTREIRHSGGTRKLTASRMPAHAQAKGRAKHLATASNGQPAMAKRSSKPPAHAVRATRQPVHSVQSARQPAHAQTKRRGKHVATPTTFESRLLQLLEAPTQFFDTSPRTPSHAQSKQRGKHLAAQQERAIEGFLRGDKRNKLVLASILGAGMGVFTFLGVSSTASNPPVRHKASNPKVDRILDKIALDVVFYEDSSKGLLSEEQAGSTPITTTTTPPPVVAAAVPPTTIPPTTTTTVRPAPVAPTEPAGSWQSLTMSLPWNGSLMLHVASCESHDDPNATNPSSGAHGLFQQLGITTDDPMQQVRDAYSLWQSQGYGAWSASRGCWG